VTVVWQNPDDGGSPITSYTIYWGDQNSANFLEYTTTCDGTDASIISSTQCTIPSTVLHEANYNLPWGSSVWTKITATNLYGTSDMSVAGNDGIIYAVPDAPVSLSENLDERTYSTLTIAWADGADSGGLAILDYKITV
jgi:hypothetical protein